MKKNELYQNNEVYKDIAVIFENVLDSKDKVVLKPVRIISGNLVDVKSFGKVFIGSNNIAYCHATVIREGERYGLSMTNKEFRERFKTKSLIMAKRQFLRF